MTLDQVLVSIDPDLLEIATEWYGEPGRYYHNYFHLAALLEFYGEVHAKLHDTEAVLHAIIFHDAIYEPTSSDNEDRSADLLSLRMTDVLAPMSLSRAVAMIQMTKRHLLLDDLSHDDKEDAAYFLDMDLAILGSAPGRFDDYERDVRYEYSDVPAAIFNIARARILTDFLLRDRLYFSDWGYRRFEMQARANLRRSLQALKADEAGL